MKGNAQCQRCGVKLEGQAVADLCGSCLLKLALEAPSPPTLPGEESLSTEPTLVRYFGDYELVREVARGGMGVVFKARQVSLNRIVALKMILAGDLSSPAMVERFRNEAEAAARLEHPNIVPIYEIGSHEGHHYFSMRFVEGGTLGKAIARERFSPYRAAELMVKVARAVHHAHQRGILHRDLKPGNILLDAAGEPHVADFGLAKLLENDSALTQSASILGTPTYMAPEQAQGQTRQATTAADVYSLGAILYEMLTGRPPFTGSSPLDVLLQVREREPASPLAVNPQLDQDLAVICLKCLEKYPGRRYGSAEALADELQRWLAHEPIQARRITALERVALWGRRKPIVAGLMSALLLVGSCGFLAVRYQHDRARREAERATAEHDRANAEATNAYRESRRVSLGLLAARRLEYASDIRLAQQALATDNPGRALELLNRHRPVRSSDVDLRGWEWRYLWNQCQGDSGSGFCQRTNPISSLATSFDGRWVALGEIGSTPLSLWDLKSRQKVSQLPSMHPDLIRFSPRESLVAFAAVTSNNQGCVTLAELPDIEKRDELPIEGFCRGLRFSNDGRRLMIITDATFQWWTVSERKRMSSRPALPAEYLDIDPELEKAAVFRKARIELIDLASGSRTWTAEADDEFGVILRFSPDGKLLAASTGWGGTDIRLLETASGKEVGRLRGHSKWIRALEFGADATTLISAGGDQTIRVWDLDTLQLLRTLRGHRREIRSLSRIPHGSLLLSGSVDGDVRVWDTKDVPRDRSFLKFKNSSDNWHFASDSSSIFIVDEKRRILRSAGSDFQRMETWMDHGPSWEFSLRSLLFSGDGRMLAVGSTNDVLQFWDLRQRTLSSSFKGDVSSWPFAFTDSNRFVTVSIRDDTFHEWDLASQRKLRSWRSAEPRLPNPSQAQGGWGFDTAGWTSRMGYVALSANGRWNLLLAYDGSAVMKDVWSHTQIEASLNPGAINAIAFSPDSRFLAVASGDGFTRIWDSASLNDASRFRGFSLNVHSLAFSPDGRRLAVGGSGKDAISLWDLESQQQLVTLEGQGAEFHLSAFSPDGRILGSMNTKGMLHLWRAPSLTEIDHAENSSVTPGTTPSH